MLNVPDTARGKKIRCGTCQAVMSIPVASSSAAIPQPAANSMQAKCPHCSVAIKVPAGAQGKTLRCGKCEQMFKIPSTLAGTSSGSTVNVNRQKPQGPSASLSPAAPKPVAAANPPDDIWGSMPSATASATTPRPMPAANPYATPTSVGQNARPQAGGYLPSGRSPVLYIIPAVVMMGWSTLLIVLNIVQCGLAVLVIANMGMPDIDAQMVGNIAGRFFAFVAQVAIFTGGLGMLRLKNLSSAKWAAGLTAFPCFGCIVFPFGIWACVLLFSYQADQDFD